MFGSYELTGFELQALAITKRSFGVRLPARDPKEAALARNCSAAKTSLAPFTQTVELGSFREVGRLSNEFPSG